MKKKEEIITPSQLLEKRRQLVNKYGEKIIKGPTDNMTDEEKAACILYRAMSDELHKAAPGTVTPDQVYEFYVRQGVNGAFGLIVKYAVKAFWVLLAIAILLAVLKFLFS